MLAGFVVVWAVLVVDVAPTAEEAAPSFFPLQTRWTTDLEQPIVAPPAYDDLHAYIPLRDGSLTAVRLDDGQVEWTIEQATEFSPVAGDGVVVVASAHGLIGLRALDAAVLWAVDVGSRVSAPLLWNTGWLVVVLESGEVVTFRGRDGVELWRIPLSAPLTVRPSLGGTTLFVPVTDGRIVALDLTTGRQLWENVISGSPQEILALDSVFVGATDNFFYRLSRRNGDLEWQVRTGADIVGRAVVDEDQIFFLSLDNILRSLDRKSGVQQWRKPLSGRPMGGPQIVADMILVAGVSPRLRMFDRVTGEPAGVIEGPGEFAAPPHVLRPPVSLAPGLIVTTGDGRLVAFLQATGPPRFSMTFPPGPLLPRPDLFAPEDVLPFEPIAEADTRQGPYPVVPADVLPFEPIDESTEPFAPVPR